MENFDNCEGPEDTEKESSALSVNFFPSYLFHIFPHSCSSASPAPSSSPPSLSLLYMVLCH